jgi:flagellar motor switch protein FliM
LNLGAVELSLDQLLGLRKGSEVSFELPEKFEATLDVDGKPWARCEAKRVDGCLVLGIIQTIWQDSGRGGVFISQ